MADKPRLEDIMVKIELKSILEGALQKFEDGEKKYGSLNIESDLRDFTIEAEAELIDCINYCAFMIIKLRRLRNGSLSKM